MSHGIPRPSRPTIRSEEACKKEQRSIDEYKKLDADVEAAIVSRPHDEATLHLITRVLKENPEYATRWNSRRRFLLARFDKSDSTVLNDLVRAELELLLPLLVKFPKCYAIWNHRVWILHQASRRLSPDLAKTIWQDELGLVGKMHQRDPRNFHGWNYRRFVIEGLSKFMTANADENSVNGLCESEFEYTTVMIKKNLSNFSAWHNRSMLIPQVLSHRHADQAARRALFDAELAFVKDALFLDPYDQSLWFYHQHLMTVLSWSRDQTWVEFSNHDRISILEQELRDIRDLLEDDTCTDCKWIYQYLLQHASEYLDLEAGNKLFSSQDMRKWLDKLTQLDPLRSGRWKDWAQKLQL